MNQVANQKSNEICKSAPNEVIDDISNQVP